MLNLLKCVELSIDVSNELAEKIYTNREVSFDSVKQDFYCKECGYTYKDIGIYCSGEPNMYWTSICPKCNKRVFMRWL